MSDLQLLQRLRISADRFGDSVAYREVGATSSGHVLTYRQLHDQSDALAREFAPAGVVLIALANQLQLPITLLAAWKARCTAFPISVESSASELNAAAVESGASVLVDGAGVHRLQARPVDRPDCCLMLKSSGTTGRPQIVCRDARSIDAVCNQMVEALDVVRDDRVLAVVPLSHSYGIEHGLLLPLSVGAAVHLCNGFDLPIMLNEMTRQAITFLPGVPAMYEMMTRLAPGGSRWPALRRTYSAGASLPRTVFDRASDLFGMTIEQLYGATELGSVTFNSNTSSAFDPLTVGLPMQGVDAQIVSLDDERPLPVGEEGQLCIRAESMFKRYLNAAVRPRWIDGRFATGDIARLDPQGRITITGRMSLLIDVGGLKVNPIEIEDVMSQHAGVASCVVLPIRQSETICRIKAVVTPSNADHPPGIDSLRAFAREHLAAYKVPRHFEIRSTLPRTPTGKVLRHLVDA